MDGFMKFNDTLNGIVWGWPMLILLVGCGIYLSIRVGFIQFTKFGFTMKNTLGRVFKKEEAGEGEVTPLQAVTTALAATVGTGNIGGVTGAIIIGGPGAVFWMWISAIFGMVTKYAEVLLSVNFRERNEKGDWVGGPMYYIKNGLGASWKWLGAVFCVLGAIAAFGIGNVAQVSNITDAINSFIKALTGNENISTVPFAGRDVPVTSIVIGVVVCVIVGIVLLGGIKRIGQVTERLVPIMAAIYILAALVVVFTNLKHIGPIFGLIFKGAFSPEAAIGGAYGVMFKTAIQKGIARGVFSNEAGLGSAPIAHAATSEKNPVRQGLYGIFEVFMDTIVICSLTSFVVLIGFLNNADIQEWGSDSGGPADVIASFSQTFGNVLGSGIVAIGLSLFALSTILSWSLYGVRCTEFLLGYKAARVYRWIFVFVVLLGATLDMGLIWKISDTLNGLMALPNLIALFALSGVVIKLTKEFFSNKDNLKD